MSAMEPETAEHEGAAAEKSEGWNASNTLNHVLGVLRTPNGILGLIVLAGITACFWPLLKFVPKVWLSDDGYYSHGFLVPFLAIYIAVRRWPRTKDFRVRAGWLALIPLAAVLIIMRAGFGQQMWSVMSVSLVATILFGIAFIFGWRWALFAAPPVLYLLFALPVFGSTIEQYTNPLQVYSTQISYVMLKLLGFDVYRDPGNTIIVMNRFTLDVGVPCSGLKLLLALTAFSVLFTLISNLKVWANAIILLMVFPLAMIMNGLRIMLIGVVGNTYGAEAGHQFHDYSGYITLVVCFFGLFKLARLLGWKD